MHRSLSLLILIPSVVVAQASDPSGHWEGSIAVPNSPAAVTIDLTKNGKGALTAAFSSNDIKHLPMSGVALDGKTVRMHLDVGPQQSGGFFGTLSDDGKTITGHYDTDQGGYSMPFTLSRTGDAVVDATARSGPISKALEGTWNGTLDVAGVTKRLVIELANQADGTSSGTLRSLDSAAPDISFPVIITEKGATVTLDVKTVGGSFTGTLGTDGATLTGNWIQGTSTLPLTFRRGPR